MAGFFRNGSHFLFGRGLCFVLPAAGCAEGWREQYDARIEFGWVPWHMLFKFRITSRSKQPRGWCSAFEKPYRGLKTCPSLQFFSCKDFVFPRFPLKMQRQLEFVLLRLVMLEQSAAVKPATTAGIRVATDATAAAAAAAECACVRDCLATPCSCLSRARCASAIE